MRTAHCAPAALAALALAGCGGLDSDKAESEIEKGIREQTGVKEVQVDCPDDVDTEKGATFRCRATAEGEKAPVSVTQQDDEGKIRWRFERP